METMTAINPGRQNKAYLERVYYWTRKGLTRSQAEERARMSRRPDTKIPGLRTNATVTGFPLFKVPGLIHHTTYPPVTWKVNIQAKQAQNSLAILDVTHLAFCGLIVVGATCLLVRSSADALGGNLESWIKAILLEVSILGLSVYKSTHLAEKIVSKLGTLLLIGLSFFVLHIGVRAQEDQALSGVESTSESLNALREDRQRLLLAHDALPQDRVTKRTQLLTDIRLVSERIEREREKAFHSSTAATVRNFYSVEAMVRAALMFINLVFFHSLINWRRRITGS